MYKNNFFTPSDIKSALTRPALCHLGLCTILIFINARIIEDELFLITFFNSGVYVQLDFTDFLNK